MRISSFVIFYRIR